MARDPDRYLIVKQKFCLDANNSYKDFNELRGHNLVEEFGEHVQHESQDNGIILTDAQKIEEYLRPQDLDDNNNEIIGVEFGPNFLNFSGL